MHFQKKRIKNSVKNRHSFIHKSLMNISRIEHIGIAVENLQEAVTFFENVYGFKCYAIEEVPDQKVRTAFFMVGETKIELL